MPANNSASKLSTQNAQQYWARGSEGFVNTSSLSQELRQSTVEDGLSIFAFQSSPAPSLWPLRRWKDKLPLFYHFRWGWHSLGLGNCVGRQEREGNTGLWEKDWDKGSRCLMTSKTEVTSTDSNNFSLTIQAERHYPGIPRRMISLFNLCV